VGTYIKFISLRNYNKDVMPNGSGVLNFDVLAAAHGVLCGRKVAGSNPGLDSDHILCPMTNNWFASVSVL
jgi:hypothetical protein